MHKGQWPLRISSCTATKGSRVAAVLHADAGSVRHRALKLSWMMVVKP